jgi:tRNA threonylcarbamoyladenosine modification (KEOPS) complex  Pcc1 subunit
MATRSSRFSSIPNIPQSGLTDAQSSIIASLKENVELLVGAGFTISGVTVPSLDDYNKLAVNVQQLANDVASLRATVNTLINQLKG